MTFNVELSFKDSVKGCRFLLCLLADQGAQLEAPMWFLKTSADLSGAFTLRGFISATAAWAAFHLLSSLFRKQPNLSFVCCQVSGRFLRQVCSGCSGSSVARSWAECPLMWLLASVNQGRHMSHALAQRGQQKSWGR